MSGRPWRSVVYLGGGVGGARLLHGLAQLLVPGTLTAIVNTGDDFEHLGLTICPDLDTCMYTLAGLSDELRGWGLRAETFHALGAVERLGGPTWFHLGDRDLGTHLARTEMLRRGESLSAVTHKLSAALGVRHHLLPMSDTSRCTIVDSVSYGPLPFQDWLVRHQAPKVRFIRFVGDPTPAPGVIEAIDDAEVVLIGPSNPFVSIDPILALSGVLGAVARRPVVALSPIVGGRAVKGPLAEMIQELQGCAASAGAVAEHYGELLDGMVVERGDQATLPASLPSLATSTVMAPTVADRKRLAHEVLAFAETLL